MVPGAFPALYFFVSYRATVNPKPNPNSGQLIIRIALYHIYYILYSIEIESTIQLYFILLCLSVAV
jgi:hypothetical protein